MTTVCHVCNGIGRLADFSLCPACGGRRFIDGPERSGGPVVLEPEREVAGVTGTSAEIGTVFVARDNESYTHPTHGNIAFYVRRRERPDGGESPGIYVIDPDFRSSVLSSRLPQWRCLHSLAGLPQSKWLQLQYVDGRLLPVQLCFVDGQVYASWLP